MSREEQVEALAAVIDRADDRWQHGIGSGGYDVSGPVLGIPIRALADAILDSPAFRTILADERAAALREAADKWQWGEWAVLTAPIKAESQPQRIIGAAQAVTDWLRDRADEVTR